MRTQQPTTASPTREGGTASAEKPPLVDRDGERAVLDIWMNVDVYPGAPKKSDSTTDAPAKPARPRKATRKTTYVLREMPTPLNDLTLSAVCQKVYQDMFLKAAVLQGHQVIYVPAWETYPLWIEEGIIGAATSKTGIKLSVLRKRSRAQHKQALEAQKQQLYQLGIFADWETSQRVLESRQESKLSALMSRLRDSDYLQDHPYLSPWCPTCTVPIPESNLMRIATPTLNGYVKFPFKEGLEAYGVDVFFCLRIPHLWEIAGVVALGITGTTPYWLTRWEDEYLLFSEPHLARFTEYLPEDRPKPERIKAVNPAELEACTLAAPLFSPRTADMDAERALPIKVIPEAAVAAAESGGSGPLLEAGVMPLSPAHHQPSYAIAKALDLKTTPVFDESGRFTEDVEQLCGLYVLDAEKFIARQLEKNGYLVTTEKSEEQAPHCPRCSELTLFRPCSKWVFSVPENRSIAEVLNAEEYWEGYGESTEEAVQAVRAGVQNFRPLQVSAQRQWGMPIPILLCAQCDQPLKDKNTLNAIRNTIQKGFESWFRLSVDELLSAETRCPCGSSQFRKETALIGSRFANLLQIIENSDFKKQPVGHINLMFIPPGESPGPNWAEWLADLSVLSAVLSKSRPIKESQPFKKLQFSMLPDIGGDIAVDDAFFNQYPADVVRLVAITPSPGTEPRDPKALKGLADAYLSEYQSLRELFARISEKLYFFFTDAEIESVSHEVYSVEADIESPGSGESTRLDLLAVVVAAQCLREVQQAYENADFHGIWRLLTRFCADDLLFYMDAMEARPATELHSSQPVLLEITAALLQRLAPVVPFLAEHFYHLTSGAAVGTDRSIFEENWHQFSPILKQTLQASDKEVDAAKAEWEAVKNAGDAEGE